MNRAAARHRADRDWEPALDRAASKGVGLEVRNRQAAALCLAAAADAGDAIERTFLQRRAADLILPRHGA